MLTRELLARLPKAELHTHLDSALRPATMVELAREAKFALPTTDPDALRRFMVVSDAGSLEDYLARFEYTIPLLQTTEGIERVSYEMVEDAARDGLRYLEVRYCPKLSTRGGLTMAAALEAELRGLARGERDFGVITRVINCSLRHYSPEMSLAIARLSVAYRDRGVVAFDLAGGEAGGRPACTRRRSTSRPTAASASPSTPARPRAPRRSPRRCTAAMPTASATGPGCTRIRCCSDYRSGPSAARSRSTSPATSRPGRWPGRRSILFAPIWTRGWWSRSAPTAGS